MAFSSETAKPLNELAEVLLRGGPGRTRDDCHYVSSQNHYYFCQHAHGALAAYRLGEMKKW